ncbi:MAG: YidC/Oxa1 family membrane protein insertase [Chloroflexota bacterium]|nr:YidC/Oxa1 family membrane protein insertase [Chloroflexota bacterium]
MDFILNPFVTLLTFFYSIFNDMVLSIIVFTVLIKMLTYPLTAQQLRSTQKMQKIQPEMKRLQEKYKNDREKLSQEQMALYKVYGVNPVGGCLPLFIQFPIFLALYQAINYALAAQPTQLMGLTGRLLIPGLDQAIPLNPLWLGLDLTQPPPISAPPSTLALIISLSLPILTMITTWVSFKISMPPPQPTEDGKPNQAQAMSQSMGTIMPLMYGFFALSFSVGLSIYFIVSNLIQIFQYTLMGRANFRNLFGRAQPAIVTGSLKTVTVTETTTANGKPKRITPVATTKSGGGKPRVSGNGNTRDMISRQSPSRPSKAAPKPGKPK